MGFGAPVPLMRKPVAEKDFESKRGFHGSGLDGAEYVAVMINEKLGSGTAQVNPPGGGGNHSLEIARAMFPALSPMIE